uniref:CSON004567 protein n=1 Tax=Culicoides sonorensis TaxID=179676 RepID=A0A336L597_CULSO
MAEKDPPPAELSKLKRLRSTKQGHLTRQKNYFTAKQGELDLESLEHLLKTIDDLQKGFEDVEEQIVMIDPEYDEVPDEEEIPDSPAAKKFNEDYNSLRIQIVALINAKQLKMKKKEEAVVSSKCRLPKLELPHFDGELTRWMDFKNEFKSLTSDKTLTNVDRFRLLKSALGEKPRQVVASMEISEDNFKDAWSALEKRYENQGLVFRSHINKILSLQGAAGAKVEHYRELLDKSQAHYRAMQKMGSFEHIADNFLISVMLTKLDSKCQLEWEDYTDDEISSWEEFTTFLEKYTSTMEKVQQTRQQIANSPLKSTPPSTTGKKHSHLAATGMNKCYKCNSTAHRLKECVSFLKLSPQERINEVKRLKICLKCLASNHTFKSCRVTCSRCKKPHNTLLHLESLASTNRGDQINSNTSDTTPPSSPTSPQFHTPKTFLSSKDVFEEFEDDNALLASILITVYDEAGRSFPIHAILDSGSTGNICSERLATLIGAKRYKSNIEIGGIGTTSAFSKKRCIIRFSSNCTGKTFEIHASILHRVTENYPAHEFDISSWKIPEKFPLADPEFNKPQEIDLLIGAGLFWSILKPERLVLGPGLPFLQHTEFGYIVAGPLPTFDTQIPKSLNAIRKKSDENESLRELVQRFWEVDTLTDHKDILSPSDQYCEDFFTSTTKRDDTGRYIVRLPFRAPTTELGTSHRK